MSTPQIHSSTGPIDVIRHEERLLLGTELHATERVRLERIIVTEQRTITVDVRREEIRLTREPLTDSAAAPSVSASASTTPIVMILHEEQILMTKSVVPTERVTLVVHTVTEDREITETLHHERIDSDSSHPH